MSRSRRRSSSSSVSRSVAPERTYSRRVSRRSSGGRWSCSVTRVPFWKTSSSPCRLVSPTSARRSVVFPVPFGPDRATRSRRSTLNETPSKSGSPPSSLRRLDAITTAIAVRVRPVVRVLAVDVGTSSVRAGLYDEAAEPVSDVARREYDGETDPDRVVALTREAVDDAVAGGSCDAVGGSCFGHSPLALDERGQPPTPILGWRDTRSANAAEWLARRLDADAAHARTGCHVHTSYWPAKLAWLAEEQPDVMHAARRFVSFADYLYMQLLELDDVPTSTSLASGTGLLDLASRTWDPELLELLALDPKRLPEIDDAAVNGWYPALHDGTCANVGAGCVSRERAALTLGTSGALRTVYEAERPLPRPGRFLYLVDERRVVEGGSVSDGGNVHAWLDDTLREASGSLAGRDPDSHGVKFGTMLGGERSPGWHTHAKGLIHGLTLSTTPLDLKQAALEGIAFRCAQIAELMPEVEAVVATGGALLNDDDWLQITADALGRPVTVSRVEEASLRGGAVIALERLGKNTAAAPLGRVVEPRPEHADSYTAARERQRALYRAATGEDTS